LAGSDRKRVGECGERKPGIGIGYFVGRRRIVELLWLLEMPGFVIVQRGRILILVSNPGPTV
jgi:hypothetical protein